MAQVSVLVPGELESDAEPGNKGGREWEERAVSSFAADAASSTRELKELKVEWARNPKRSASTSPSPLTTCGASGTNWMGRRVAWA